MNRREIDTFVLKWGVIILYVGVMAFILPEGPSAGYLFWMAVCSVALLVGFILGGRGDFAVYVLVLTLPLFVISSCIIK